MIEVCPLFRGCDAEYPSKFFKEVIGLCDHGTLLKNILKETKITMKMVLGSWSEGTASNWYPWKLCNNPMQVHVFKEHYTKVYGGMLDNTSFSMKFLASYFTCLIYKTPVNWVEEAASRRMHRVRGTCIAALKKLMEPMGYREQMTALV